MGFVKSGKRRRQSTSAQCLRTCSLPCVNAHKHRTGCNGRRNITCFVPLSHFDDNLLLSGCSFFLFSLFINANRIVLSQSIHLTNSSLYTKKKEGTFVVVYNLLEETKSVAESARRIRSKLFSCYPPHFKLPFVLRTLRTAAASRRTKLLFLPTGMFKRENNQTRFHQRKYISWTIEWRFHSTDVVLLDHGVHEDTSLCSLIENHLKPSPWNHPLRQFCQEQIHCLKFFIRKYPKGSKSPFRELDIRAPIWQQLADTVSLEYPVIHVFLPSEHYDFEVVRENHPITHRPEGKDSSSADNEIPKGVTFKEEEIEDNDSSLDPPVFDLMNHVISSPMHQIPHQNKSEKAFSNSVWSLSTRAGEGNRVHSSSQTKDSEVFQDME